MWDLLDILVVFVWDMLEVPDSPLFSLFLLLKLNISIFSSASPFLFLVIGGITIKFFLALLLHIVGVGTAGGVGPGPAGDGGGVGVGPDIGFVVGPAGGFGPGPAGDVDMGLDGGVGVGTTGGAGVGTAG